MWDAAFLPLRSAGAWRSRLSPLLQGPAERRRQSPSDGRMVVLRQFKLLLWKNYILQVGWRSARGGCLRLPCRGVHQSLPFAVGPGCLLEEN